MYVPLKARMEVPRGETWPHELRLAGRQLLGDDGEGQVSHLGKPQLVLDLLYENDGLIILGDPGAGKTTFLKYLALKLARGEGEDLGLGEHFPVLVPLSAYATVLAEEDVRLDEFIADHFCERVADLPIDAILEGALEKGRALVLLDGLDEVREPSLRHTVVDRVVDFYTFHRRAGNKFALTSRIMGYREVRPTAEGLVECTLVDFGEEEIEAFVDRWTEAIERAARGETEFAAEEAQRERAELLDAIGRNPGVRGLAANPLLLTILALMKRQDVKLPERRVQLYDKYVETLLSSWNLARGLGRPPTRDLDVVQTVRILAPLALWMHEQSLGAGLVKREDLKRKLAGILAAQGDRDPEQSVEQFLEDVRDYAGILLERGAGQYGFIHLTFEEYLSAVGLARLGQGKTEPLVEVLAKRVGDPAWREVVLLTIGYLGIVQQWEEAASDVVGRLLDQRPGEPGDTAVLMADAVIDASLAGVTPACKEKVVHVLVETMRDGGVKAPVRASAGSAVARLGDPRPEVTSLERMQFCYVPPGPFWMGSGDEDEIGFDTERPLHQVDIPYGYWMARYPLTNAQFRLFREDAKGYWADTWWTKTGLVWRQEEGGLLDHEEPWNLPNYPAVLVTWFEALAFCQWLAEVFRDRLPKGHAVSLPTEAEWEKAARGGLQVPRRPERRSFASGLRLPNQPSLMENTMPLRRYPWGDRVDNTRANYNETGAGGTSVVGCFPRGVSPYGVEDLSGNVEEWCATKWEENYEGYEGDNDPGGDEARVVRGGSYLDDQRNVRCAHRRWLGSADRDYLFGFRVAVSSTSSAQF
jgi:formylglycine-generating enzyme required for sulfatase activity